MTDFFALFDQPRQPWLEPDVVKEKYHQLTRVAHPDVGAHAASIKFEEITEAYRVLSDPKLRIQHLLTLEGRPSAAVNRVVSEDLEKLFLQIGTLSQKTEQLLARMTSGNNALALSLVKSESSELRSQIERLLVEVAHGYERCVAELSELNEGWNRNRSTAMLQLETLHARMSYLSRWLAQLKEMQFQLAARG
jgi:curved DNA-binding protein CbpA